jgi:hypothetical protein
MQFNDFSFFQNDSVSCNKSPLRNVYILLSTALINFFTEATTKVFFICFNYIHIYLNKDI